MLGIELVRNIGIMIVASAGAILILRRFNVPTIVVYILVGLLLGPILGLLILTPHEGDAQSDAIATVGEIGIALLLFIVGLELSLHKIRDVGRVAVIAGLGQVVFTASIGLVLCLLLRFTMMESIFIATALTFSSTVVVVKLLDQKKELTSLYGRIAVGIFLVQDLVVIIALTFLAGLGKHDNFELATVATGLIRAFVGMGVLLLISLVAAKYLLNRVFAWASRSPETLLIWSLFWCFAFVLAAEAMGLSPEIGAFLAGVSLAQLPCSEELRRRVHPLMNFFIAIAFISLGAQMKLGDSATYWFEATILSLFVLIGNPFIFMWIISRCGYGEKTAFMTSVTVAQISEFSFIFAAMGVSAGLIGPPILSVVGVVGLVTIALSAYMILYNHVLYRWSKAAGILRMFKARQHDEQPIAETLSNHILVVGMNALGRRIASELHSAGQTVLAIDSDPRKLADLHCRTLLGNIEYHSVLEEAGLAHALLGISALNIEEANALFTYQCTSHNVPCAIHAFDWTVFDELRSLGADYLIDSKAQGSARLVEELHKRGIVDA